MILKLFEKRQTITKYSLRLGDAEASLWIDCTEEEFKKAKPGDDYQLKKVQSEHA